MTNGFLFLPAEGALRPQEFAWLVHRNTGNVGELVPEMMDAPVNKG